jgi:hypothetical protein
MRRLRTAALLGLLTWTSSVSARVTETTEYTKQQAINSAFRYLRVDSAFKITERDLDLGYLLFEYPTGSGDQTTTGSVEVIEREDEVLLIVQIAQLPSYHESRLIHGLVRKLRADYGEPPRARKPPEDDGKEAPPADDAGKDDAGKSGAKGDSEKSKPPIDAPVKRYRIK